MDLSLPRPDLRTGTSHSVLQNPSSPDRGHGNTLCHILLAEEHCGVCHGTVWLCVLMHFNTYVHVLEDARLSLGECVCTHSFLVCQVFGTHACLFVCSYSTRAEAFPGCLLYTWRLCCDFLILFLALNFPNWLLNRWS